MSSNTVTVIRTLDNAIVSQTFVGRQSHEAFFATDNRTVWVGTRGVNRIDLVDGLLRGIVGYIPSPGGPSKILFSPDGSTAYANHIRSATVSVIDVAARTVVSNITGLADTFSPDMMISASALSLWVAYKMAGKGSVIDLAPSSNTTDTVIAVVDTGPETNHPNHGIYQRHGLRLRHSRSPERNESYTQSSSSSAPIFVISIKSTGVEPHGLWPSGDNSRLYIINEHSDTLDVVDLATAGYPVIATLDV